MPIKSGNTIEVVIKGPTNLAFALREEIAALLDSIKVNVDIDRGIKLDTTTKDIALEELRKAGGYVGIITRGK